MGDFNITGTALQKKLSINDKVYGPRFLNGYYSFVFKNGDRMALDWIITKNVNTVFNDYKDKKQSPNATYDWTFVSKENGYGEKNNVIISP
ncbi:hypothetical protein [Pseudobutyrivibrio sp. LB2011]|uniref:hypothetical protein n=1 Tax=Pseudobutyrivibrio sp. LB2011 TaxID=1408312 RepID=UPI0005D25D89|nr:hypothetical protein [Pseudobutyrivibrio sp. LB2011]